MSDVLSLSGKAAIIGIGELAPMREPDGRDCLRLMIDAAKMAIDDAEIDRSEIDGLVVHPGRAYFGLPAFPSIIVEYLGHPVRYGGYADLQGASSAGTIWRAAAAIAAGLCHTVLCVQAERIDPKAFYSQRKITHGHQDEDFELPYGPMVANSAYAMIAARHAYEFGTTDRQRAVIAVAQRTNACANPDALFYGQPISVEDVLNSRVVCQPLHVLEIVRPCTGAAAVIVTSAERARRARRTPAKLLGAGESLTHCMIAYGPHMTTSPVAYSAPTAFEMAGVTPKDIDLLSIYDCYTIMVMLTIEDAGFCKKGTVGHFVEEHDLTYKGDLPINTHGGQMSFGQAGLAGGMSHVTEAVRQLRGDAGQRQLKKCDLVFVNGNGGLASEEVSLVLGR